MVPAAIRKTVMGKSLYGRTLVGAIEPADAFEEEIEKLRKMLVNIGYSGFFNAEFFTAGGEVWFNEINFACSSSVYALYRSGSNLPKVLADMLSEREADLSEAEVKDFGRTFVDEITAWREYSINRLAKKEFKALMKGQDITLVDDADDPEPYKVYKQKKIAFL